MIITCKACNASFNLNESLLKPEGSKVRCSKCKEVFIAYPPVPPKEAEKPDEIISDFEFEQETEDFETGQLDDSGSDELDLSDMDKLFSEEEIPEKEDAIDDLEMDLEPEPEKTPEDVGAEVKLGEPDELDLPDMEELLDVTEIPGEKGDTDEAIEDFDLDLDLEPEPEKPSENVEAEAKLEEPDELDLSDIEELLELEDPITDEKDESEPEEVELELDTEMEPEIAKTPEDIEASVESEELEKVDLSDIEKMFETEEKEEEELFDSPLPEETSGAELDEVEETADKLETVESSETEEIEQEFTIEDTDQDDLSEEEIADVQQVVAKTKPAMKKRISKPLIAFLILVLLGGGCYGIYVLFDFMNIKIPFVSDYLNPQISDPAGNLKINTLDIDRAFVKNKKAGKLFVITGKIKNGYSDVRSYIRVTGKLYAKGKVLVQKDIVFCGNVLSDIELSNLKLSAIKKRLLNRLGDNKSNMRVKPGQELPFMVVFANLPKNLEEFAIEVEGSVSE
ncbi:MAG: zinc-ribbon domain-containing protein [Deltaproteobacteria bacterium]|nr:zinc-ribbon domain-containing protein [Deltaproteobacteria bacterium]